MSMIGFPLLLIPLAIYNIIVWLMPDVSFADPLAKLTLLSGAVWAITLGDILLAISVVLLLLEVMKGARPSAKYLTDHLLSLVVFGADAACGRPHLAWSNRLRRHPSIMPRPGRPVSQARRSPRRTCSRAPVR